MEKRRVAVPKNRKRRAEWVELLFMARAACLGFKVAAPHGEERYDVLVGTRKGIRRVQIKSTITKESRCYLCMTAWRHRASGKSQLYRQAHIDFLAAYVVPEDSWFIIPRWRLRSRQLYLPSKKHPGGNLYEKYREAWHRLGPLEPRLYIQASAHPSPWAAVERVARLALLYGWQRAQKAFTPSGFAQDRLPTRGQHEGAP